MADIGFSIVPRNIRVPLFYAEVDNSRANTGQQTQRALILAQPTSAGTGAANTPVLSQGVTDAKVVFGQGSMGALMVDAYRRSDSFGELWLVPIPDDGAAVAATGTVQFTAVPTSPGVLSLYVAGQRVSLAVTPSQTTTQLATALAAAINALPDLPVTATSSTATVTLTAKNKGAAAGDIDLRVNYAGAAGGESTPAGLTLTITAMANGATNPSLTTALASLGDKTFDFIVCPYTDTTSLNAIKSFLSSQTGRWQPMIQLYGHAFSAMRGTLSALGTFGTGRNDEHVSVLGFNDSPSPAFVWVADFAATCAVSLRADPARPLQTLSLSTVQPPPVASRFAITDRNVLLYDGISTFTVGDDGTVRLDNVITTYQTNAFGVADNSYLQIETLFTLMDFIRGQKAVVTSQFGRVKLAADGTRIPPGGSTVTPSIVKASLVADYAARDGVTMQETARYAAGLIVQINSTNPSRLDVLADPILIGGLRIFAMLVQFRLL